MGDKQRDSDPWKRDVKKHNTSNSSKSSGSVARSAKTGRFVASAKSVERTGSSEVSARKPFAEKAVANNDEVRYVVKHNDGWAVKKENAARASAVFDTQEEAIDRAREIIQKSGGGEVRIQGADGKFRDSDSESHSETEARGAK